MRDPTNMYVSKIIILLPKRLSRSNCWIVTDVRANCRYRRRDCLPNYCTCELYLYVLQLEIIGILGTLKEVLGINLQHMIGPQRG